jgi:ribosomal protein S16
MDIYEMVTQFSILLKDGKFVNDLGKFIPDLQKTIDQGILSDAMVYAGRPIPRSGRS